MKRRTDGWIDGIEADICRRTNEWTKNDIGSSSHHNHARDTLYCSLYVSTNTVVPKRNIIKNRRTTKNSKIEHLINSNVRSDRIVNMTAVVLFYRIGSLILSIRTLNDDDDDYENKSSSLLINTLLLYPNTTHTSFNLLIILISTTTTETIITINKKESSNDWLSTSTLSNVFFFCSCL